MQFDRLPISGLVIIKPKRVGDARGWFSETFRAELFRESAARVEFVQHNQSMSAAKGTVRGLHYQIDPMAQGKLVRCLKGAILDVVVDIRKSSPTFGRHVSAELTADSGQQLWVPVGFAHGFVTLTANAEVSYLVTAYYSSVHDRGLLWNDPALDIDWRLGDHEAQLSEKDSKQPKLAELEDLFT